MDTNLDVHKSEFLNLGFTVFPSVLPAALVESLMAEGERLWEEEQRLNPKFCSKPPQKLASNIAVRSRLFDPLIEHKLVLEFGEHFLGKEFILSEMRSINLDKSEEVAFIHQDGFIKTYPDEPLSFVAFWTLDEMTAENGATFVYPGSHNFPFRVPRDPAMLKNYSGKHLEAPPGSLIIFNGNLWHGPAANRSGRNRRVLSAYYIRWFVKPYFNMIERIRKAEFDTMSPNIKKLLGFNSFPPVDEKERMRTVIPVEDIEKYFSFKH